VAHPIQPFSIGNGEGALVVRAMIRNDQVLLLLDERSRALPSIGLSPRESEVLAWVAQGKTNPEIGTILGLSVRTIQTHLDHIYRKLDVETRTAAVAKAMETR
jgi:DNA-binding CsgD family transcriptional regulator